MPDDGAFRGGRAGEVHQTTVLRWTLYLRRANFFDCPRLEAIAASTADHLRQVACVLGRHSIGAVAATAHGSVWLSPANGRSDTVELLRCRVRLQNDNELKRLNPRGVRRADDFGGVSETSLIAWREDFDAWLAVPAIVHVAPDGIHEMAERYVLAKSESFERRVRPASSFSGPPVIATGRRVDKAAVAQRLHSSKMGMG